MSAPRQGFGITHNPRDGIATLMAAVPGVKGFDTLGQYDGPDRMLKDHLVWKSFRMIWSGQASVSATGSQTLHDVSMTFTKMSATAGTLLLRLFDRNLNQLAADGPSATDGIAWTSGTCTNGGTVTLGPSGQIMEQIDAGVAFNPDPGAIRAPRSRSTWTQKTDYNNSVTISAAPDSCGISAAPQRVAAAPCVRPAALRRLRAARRPRRAVGTVASEKYKIFWVNADQSGPLELFFGSGGRNAATILRPR